LAFVCSSKDYSQKAKKGEGVPYEETQVGSSNGQTRAATTRGHRSNNGVATMGREQQHVENNNGRGVKRGNNDGQGTMIGKE
jgi:hypothetical protein